MPTRNAAEISDENDAEINNENDAEINDESDAEATLMENKAVHWQERRERESLSWIRQESYWTKLSVCSIRLSTEEGDGFTTHMMVQLKTV